MTQKANPWTFDVRVRERNLKAGTITDKDVEKYVGGLPDLGDQSEAFATSQPALLQPVVEAPAHAVHAAAASGLDDGADDIDDEDDEDEDEVDGEPAGEDAADDAAAPGSDPSSPE